MKYFLLLFTLLSACCYGQEYDTIPPPLILKSSLRVIDEQGFVYNERGELIGSESGDLFDSKMNTFLTEEKLLLYAQECWEDSTEIMTMIDERIYIIDGEDTVATYRPTFGTKYIHREPTFTGFIEWLKKK